MHPDDRMIQTSEKKLFQKIAGLLFHIGKGKMLELTIRERKGFLTRFAKNEIHQNSSRNTLHLSIRMIEKGRSARVEITDPDPPKLQNALCDLEALVRSREKTDGELPLIRQPAYRDIDDLDPRVREQSPLQSAQELAKIFGDVKQQKAYASGYYSATARSVYLANSKGLEAYHRSSSFRFGLTIRKGKGIGYASHFSTHQANLKWNEVLKEAVDHASQAEHAVRIKPGLYTVILAPRAFSEFASPLFEDMNGRKVADRDSYFSNRKGKKIFSRELFVEDNVYHPDQTGLPFDGVGLPRRKISLVERGVVKNFVYDQKAAHDLHVKPTGHTAGALQASTMPVNVVVQNGQEKLSHILKSLNQALFISHLWYHQITNTNHFLATGLIKGSALLWRKGEWAGGANHVRYLESIPSALNRVIAVTADYKTIKDREYGASVLPFLVISDFRIV